MAENRAIEAEQSILGACLRYPVALQTAMESLKPDDFYLTKHRLIFTAIQKSYDLSGIVDLITVPNELEERGQLEDAGKRLYLFELFESVVSPSNIENHIGIVLEVATRNKLLEHCQTIIDQCQDGQGYKTNAILGDLEERLSNLRDRQKHTGVLKASDLTQGALDELYDIANGKIKPGLMTGWNSLDEILTGFKNGNMIIVAGRPSMGKTSLAINIIDNVAVDLGTPTLLFSMEMSPRAILQRMLCARARVSMHEIKRKRTTEENDSKLFEAFTAIAQAPFYIDGSPDSSIRDIRARARKVKDKYGVRLIVIDYLQLITGPQSENRTSEVTAISKNIKSMARELDIPIIVLSQLNRNSERGKNIRPGLADLRDSGALEQDADVVIMIHRDKDDKGLPKEETEIVVAKHRDGPTDMIKMMFFRDYTLFVLPTDREEYGD